MEDRHGKVASMEDIPAFFELVLWNLATVVSGIFFGIEPALRLVWSGYDQWADQHLKFNANTRRNLRILIGILALVVASYLVYHASMNEVRRLQTEVASYNKSAKIVYTYPGGGDSPRNGKSPGMRLYFTNAGSLPSVGLIFEHKYKAFDHQLTNADQNAEIENVKQTAGSKHATLSDSEIQPTVQFSILAEDRDDILTVKKEGSDMTYYLFAVAEYKDRMLPSGEWWITEICLEMSKKGTVNCPTDNKIYRSK
jgi:hypothetical protein